MYPKPNARRSEQLGAEIQAPSLVGSEMNPMRESAQVCPARSDLVSAGCSENVVEPDRPRSAVLSIAGGWASNWATIEPGEAAL